MSDVGFFTVIGLFVVGVLLSVPILVLVLWSRVRRLEHEVRELQLSRGAEPGAKPWETAFRPPAESPAVPEPALEIQDWVQDAERRPAVPQQSLAGAAERQPAFPVPADATSEETASSLEELLARKWLTWVGAIAVVIGAGFFFKYTIDVGLIGPTGRVMIGLLVGMACFAGGAWAVLREYRWLGQALIGAAAGILYFSLFAAFHWYEIVPLEAAFGGMCLTTAAALAFAAYFDALPTAVLGVLGGFLVPVMLSTGVDPEWRLFAYILILDLGVLGVAGFRKWHALQALAFVGTLALWLGWLVPFFDKDLSLASTVAWMTVYFLVFACLGVWHNVLRRVPAEPADFFLILATPVAYFIGLYGVTEERFGFLHGLMAVLLAGVYLLLGILALLRHPEGKRVVVALCGIAASFLTVAIPLQLTGHWIAIAWAAESLLLVELGLRFREDKLRWAGFGVMSVVLVILMHYALSTFGDPAGFQTTLDLTAARGAVVDSVAKPTWTDVLNGRSFSFLAAVIALSVMAWEHRRLRLTLPTEAPGGDAAAWLLALAPLTLLLLLWVETYAAGYARDWLGPTFSGLFMTWTALAGLALVLLAVTVGPRSLATVGAGVFAMLALLVVISAVSTFATWSSDWSGLGESARANSAWRFFGLNPRGGGYLIAIAATTAAAIVASRVSQPTGSVQPRELHQPQMLGILAYLSGLAMLTLEVYAQGVIRDWETATALAITGVWTGYAVATLVAGIYHRSATVRVLALSLFVLTTGKVFLYDVWKLDPKIRTVAFVGLGCALLLVSFLYRRFRERINAWIAPALIVCCVPLAHMLFASPAAAADQQTSPLTPEDLLEALPQRWVVRQPDLKEETQPPSGAMAWIVVPPELYGVARRDLGDVRIMSLDGSSAPREVPYVLRTPQDISKRARRPAPLLNLSQVGTSTQFLLDVGETTDPVNELTVLIDKKRHNYERPVKIYGTDRRDAESWNLLTDRGYLLDVTRPRHRMRVKRIPFPQSRFRYYKVAIENGRDPPLPVTGAELWDRKETKIPRHEYPARIVSASESKKDKATTLVLDLGFGRLPTVGLRVDVDYEGNFHRPVTVETAEKIDNKPKWRPVVTGDLYRIERPDLKAKHLTLEYAESAGRYLRLTITNGDDSPLKVTKCVALGIDKLLFVERRHFAATGQTFAVYVGSERLTPPVYDLQRTIGILVPDERWRVRIGTMEDNPRFQGPLKPKLPWSEEHQPLIWGLTIGGVALLGLLTVLLLYKAARRAS